MCREEFRLRNFKLWHPILRDFTHSRVSSNIDLWSPRWLFTKKLRKIWCSGQEWVILHGTWVCANLFGCMTDLLINSDLLALFAIVKRPAKKVYLHLPIYHWQQITKLYCEVYEIIQRRKRRLKDGIWSGVVGVPKKMAYISASVLGSYRDEQVFGCLEAKLILAGGMGRGIYLHLW